MTSIYCEKMLAITLATYSYRHTNMNDSQIQDSNRGRLFKKQLIHPQKCVTNVTGT